jgi:hypothetical protein
MSKHTPCKPYVWERPTVLLETGLMWHSYETGPCASEIVNQIILLYSIAFLAGAVLTMAAGSNLAMTVSIGAATLFSLPSFWTLIHLRSTVTPQPAAAQASPKKEGFQAGGAAAAAVPDGVYHVIGSGAAPATNTLPTARNPFMNVLLDEIKYNPVRPMAASVLDPSVKVTLDDFFRTEFTADPTDVFGRSQSQRQFVTMPSTSIPNDRESYQNWLYKIPGKTCKEGGREACLPGTDGGALPWLNADH